MTRPPVAAGGVAAKSSEHKARVRRPADLLIAVLALVSIGLLFAIAHGLPIGTSELTNNVASWLTHHIPRPLAFVFVSAVWLGCLAFAVVATVTMLRTDSRDALNALVALLLAVATTSACVIEWQDRRSGIAMAMLRGTNAAGLLFPVGFVAFLTGTDLTRRSRWTRWCILTVALLPLSELSLDDLTFFAVLAVPLGGWAIGLIVRWVLEVASVRPDPLVLLNWLQQSGVPAEELTEDPDDRSLVGTLRDGTGFIVLLENRDTRGAGIARRLWRLVRLRSAEGGAEVFSSRTQLKERALASYSAIAADVIAPRVLLFGEIPPETLVLALTVPNGHAPSATSPFTDLVTFFAALRRLHTAGVAQRVVRLEHLLIEQDSAGFSSMERAQTGAGALVRRLDIAQGLATLASVVGPSEAVKAFREGYQPTDEGAVASILQPVALAPWGWSAMRSASGCLAAVRREFVGSDELSTPIRLERFRWRTVLSTVALTVAAFLLVGQLSKVNLLAALSAMNPGWFLVAIAASALTYLAAAANLAVFVPKRLSLRRGFAVQLSTAFVGVAMPPTIGHVAVNSRYLHRQGVEPGAITAAVAVSQIVNVVTTVPLLLIIGVLTGAGVSRFKIVPGPDVLIGLGCIALTVGVLIAISPTRALLAEHVWKPLRTVVPRFLEAISQPLRLFGGVSANLVLTGGYVLALYAALLAVGAHPAVLAAAAVYLAGNTVGSIAPTPGGLGAVEAVLTAGLTAIGVPAHEAVPAVLLFRVATFWLPIPVGWLSYLVLERSGTL